MNPSVVVILLLVVFVPPVDCLFEVVCVVEIEVVDVVDVDDVEELVLEAVGVALISEE